MWLVNKNVIFDWEFKKNIRLFFKNEGCVPYEHTVKPCDVHTYAADKDLYL